MSERFFCSDGCQRGEVRCDTRFCEGVRVYVESKFGPRPVCGYCRDEELFSIRRHQFIQKYTPSGKYEIVGHSATVLVTGKLLDFQTKYACQWNCNLGSLICSTFKFGT